MEAGHPTFGLVLALAAGVLAQSMARHLRVPGIVLLLAAGIGLGPDGLGWVNPRELGDGLYAIVDLAVAVILFEGGLNLQLSRLRREQAAIRRLVTWGALVTLLGGALAARWLLDWGWENALLFGSLVVVTGPTVVGPLITELRLKPRVATVLEAEGVLIDPIGAIGAVLVLELVLAPDVDSLGASGLALVSRLGFGLLAGAIGGLVISRMLGVRRLIPEGFENIVTLAAVLLLFQGCDVLVSHSGILAVTIAGTVVGNLGEGVDRDLREFKDQLSVLLIGLLFVVLAADVRFAQVQGLGVGGLLVVGALILLVRPLGVFLVTRGSDLTLRERGFVAWVAPRGIVAAAVASIVAGTLEREQIAGGLELRALVFLTITCTVVLAGLTAGPVGRWLGVRLPGRDGVAILSVNALGLALADALRAAGRPVVFLDSNPQRSRLVEEAGHPVVFGNAIQERVMQRARFESIDTVVALTGNDTLNGVFVRRARELFGVPKGLVATNQAGGGLASEMVGKDEADVVFDGRHDVQRWDVRARRGDVEIVRRRYGEPLESAGEGEETSASGLSGSPSSGGGSGERSVILAVERSEKVVPMSGAYKPRRGDEATVAIHVPDREEALRQLEAAGWWEVPEMVDDDSAEGSAGVAARAGEASGA